MLFRSSLSNLEARCDVKQDSQFLNGSCTPLESIEYMESGEHIYILLSPYMLALALLWLSLLVGDVSMVI